MNMVLRDVEERYTVRLHVPRKDSEERLRPVQEHRQRTLKQIYVRGACVVLVSAVPPPATNTDDGAGQVATT